MNNVMLDLETWGTRPGCAIRSVGAVMFDPISGSIGNEFYANVSDESCVMAGLFVQDDTAAWWDRQSQDAQDALLVDPKGIYVVVQMFHQWFRKNKGVFIWSQGANFDEVIWSAIAHKLGQRPPWKFYDVRDTRTAYEIAGFDARTVKRAGTYHNALDDARHQAYCVSQAFGKCGWK
jgi:hypothetical protein